VLLLHLVAYSLQVSDRFMIANRRLPMSNNAERIRRLREQTGKSSAEIAALAGLGDMAYFDLEFHDDELVTVPSLAQVKRLADTLGVPTVVLFFDEPPPRTRRISYAELVLLIKDHLAGTIDKDGFEDEIGWYLDDFLESEDKAFAAYGIEFLQALCQRLGVEWTDALP